MYIFILLVRCFVDVDLTDMMLLGLLVSTVLAQNPTPAPRNPSSPLYGLTSQTYNGSMVVREQACERAACTRERSNGLRFAANIL